MNRLTVHVKDAEEGFNYLYGFLHDLDRCGLFSGKIGEVIVDNDQGQKEGFIVSDDNGNMKEQIEYYASYGFKWGPKTSFSLKNLKKRAPQPDFSNEA